MTLTAPCVLDVPYGPEPEQQIDIYLPDRPRPAGVPVFIFFHGGSTTHGYNEWLGFMALAFTCMPAFAFAG